MIGIIELVSIFVTIVVGIVILLVLLKLSFNEYFSVMCAFLTSVFLFVSMTQGILRFNLYIPSHVDKSIDNGYSVSDLYKYTINKINEDIKYNFDCGMTLSSIMKEKLENTYYDDNKELYVVNLYSDIEAFYNDETSIYVCGFDLFVTEVIGGYDIYIVPDIKNKLLVTKNLERKLADENSVFFELRFNS